MVEAAALFQGEAPPAPRGCGRALLIVGVVVGLLIGLVALAIHHSDAEDQQQREAFAHRQVPSPTEATTDSVSVPASDATAAEDVPTQQTVEVREIVRYDSKQVDVPARVYVDINALPRAFHIRGCPSITSKMIKAPIAGMITQGIVRASDCAERVNPTDTTTVRNPVYETKRVPRQSSVAPTTGASSYTPSHLYTSPSYSDSTATEKGGSVHVHGYTKSNGTYVQPYTRGSGRH